MNRASRPRWPHLEREKGIPSFQVFQRHGGESRTGNLSHFS